MMKGALVEFMTAFGTQIPNVVMFQYNPETLRHSWSQPMAGGAAAGQAGQAGSNPYAVGGAPSESYSFTLSMDVTDQLSDPNPMARSDATRHGIYPRLAALEMLLYPSGDSQSSGSGGGGGGGGGAGGGSGGGGGGGGEKHQTPTARVPVVLFVWGTSRIVPVRVTSLSVTEKLYDDHLNPTHADAQIDLRVLTPTELESVPGILGRIAKAAYDYSQGERSTMAASNLGDSARAIIGMLGDKRLLMG